MPESGVIESPTPTVRRGASNFSEFDVASGLPAGITEYDGGDAGDPTAWAIEEDPVEGNYLAIKGQVSGLSRFFGYGIDSFDGVQNQATIEVLGRIWVGTFLSNGIKWGGPACSMSDSNWFFSLLEEQDPEPYHIEIGQRASQLAVNVDIAEAAQQGVWAWIRWRRQPDGIGNEDVKAKAWFGEISDEPAAWDIELDTVTAGPLGDGAIGFAMSGPVSGEDLKIAFVSFTTGTSPAELDAWPPFEPNEIGEEADPWTPVEDEATAWAACGEVVTELTLELTSTGLVFRDQFDRADSNTLGNSWEESESAASDLSISGNQVRGAAVGNSYGAGRPAGEIGATDPTLVQVNVRGQSGSLFLLRARANDIIGTDGYRFFADFRDGQEDWILNKLVGGSSTTLCLSTVDPPLANQWRGVRGMVKGTNVKLLSTGVLANGQDLSEDFVSRCDETDDPAIEGFDRTTFERLDAVDAIDLDEFIVCGVEIVVSGLPTGWKAQVDGRAAVTEVGGVATLDPTTWALPAGTIRVLDDGDVEQVMLTPAAGIWGGDVYEFSMVAGSGGIVTDWSGKADEATAWVACEA